MENKTLVGVTLIYSDGTKKHLQGEEECKKWSIYNEQVAIIAMIHGSCPPYDKLNWEEEGKYDNNDE